MSSHNCLFFKEKMAGFFGLGSLIPHSRPPLLTRLVGSFICTCFAPELQAVFIRPVFVELTLGLPALAPSTSLLFHPVNNSMTLLISIIFFQTPPLFLVTLLHICPHAVFAPWTHSAFGAGVFAKLTLVFPLSAFCTLLHLSHSPLVSHSQPPHKRFCSLAHDLIYLLDLRPFCLSLLSSSVASGLSTIRSHFSICFVSVSLSILCLSFSLSFL